MTTQRRQWTDVQAEELLDLLKEGFTVSEVATLLNMTVGMVAGKFSRIRENFATEKREHRARPVLLPPKGWVPMLTVLFIIAFSTPSDATPEDKRICAPRTMMHDILKRKFGEERIAIGVTNDGGLVEVLTSMSSDRWTIIISTPNGQSCFVAAGEDWRTSNMLKGQES